ncbi:11228_t:CDS:2, partial [Gigaspora margarita]
IPNSDTDCSLSNKKVLEQSEQMETDSQQEDKNEQEPRQLSYSEALMGNTSRRRTQEQHEEYSWNDIVKAKLAELKDSTDIDKFNEIQ